METINDLGGKKTTANGIAACLGVSRRWVYQLVSENIIPKPDNGKFPIVESVVRYCAYLRSGAIKGESIDYEQEKAKHEAAKRELAELKLAKYKGEIHEERDLEIMIGGMLTVFRRRMLAIPHKMAKVLQDKTPEEIDDILSKEIDLALTELAECDASKFAGDEEITEDSKTGG